MEPEKREVQEEKKIVNLCEDMRPHKHDEKSYEKAQEAQKKQESKKD